MNWLDAIKIPEPTAYLEIVVLAVLFYYAFIFLRGTRGAQVLYGFVFVFVLLIVLTRFFHLDALNWILQRFSVYLAIAFVVIFQPEIRRALAELGKQSVFVPQAAKQSIVDQVVSAVLQLSRRRIGALIAVEMEIGTRAICETGTRVDGMVTSELLASIFYPHTPLHDGGVIIRENRILAAGCVFPLSSREDLGQSLGTRHRAAVGLSEETDAVVLVVSEETGTISMAHKGRLHRGLNEERLRRLLAAALFKRKGTASRLTRLKEQLDLTPEGVAETERRKTEESTRGG